MSLRYSFQKDRIYLEKSVQKTGFWIKKFNMQIKMIYLKEYLFTSKTRKQDQLRSGSIYFIDKVLIFNSAGNAKKHIIAVQRKLSLQCFHFSNTKVRRNH